jgi:hypothetical protein
MVACGKAGRNPVCRVPSCSGLKLYCLEVPREAMAAITLMNALKSTFSSFLLLLIDRLLLRVSTVCVRPGCCNHQARVRLRQAVLVCIPRTHSHALLYNSPFRKDHAGQHQNRQERCSLHGTVVPVWCFTIVDGSVYLLCILQEIMSSINRH